MLLRTECANNAMHVIAMTDMPATFGKPRFTAFSCASRALNNEGASKRTQHVVISLDIGAVDSPLNHQEQDGLSGQGIKAFYNVKNTPYPGQTLAKRGFQVIRNHRVDVSNGHAFNPPARVGGSLDESHSAISDDLYLAQQQYKRLRTVIGRICNAVHGPSNLGRHITKAKTRASASSMAWKRSNKGWSSASGINFSSFTENPHEPRADFVDTPLNMWFHGHAVNIAHCVSPTRILIVTVEPLPPYGSNFVVYLGRTDKRFLDGNIRRPLLWRQGRMYPNRRSMHILDYELLLMVHEDITD